jgi:DNA-binding GntR family transcriptional regulator
MGSIETPDGRISELEARRNSTAEQVADLLRENILEGELRPGTPLREHRLSKQFGISRNTLREALRLLAREGLVTYHLNRGVVVTQLGEDDVVDIFGARRTIEAAAVQAAARADDKELARLEMIAAEFSAAAGREDWRAMVEIDLRFHLALVALLENKRLRQLFESLEAEMRLSFAIVDRSMVYEGTLYAEHHEELVRLLRERKARPAREVLMRHLAHAEGRLRELARAQAAVVGDPLETK